MCLSAQSNPQGVPKELLEAKKLELIQEKVGYLPVYFAGFKLIFPPIRSMLRKLPKRHNVAKSKSDSEIETLTTSGNEREGNEEAVAVVEAIEGAIVISIGVRHAIQDHHLRDAEARHLAFVILLPHVRLIHTFRPAEVVVDQMTGGADHLLLEDRLPTRDLDPGAHHVEDTKMRILRDRAVDVLQADLALLHAGNMLGIEIIEFGDVVIIEQDPIHLQIPLAHVRPDEVENDVLPLSHLAARHHLEDRDIITEDGIDHLPRALAQQAGTANLRADQEEHLPMTVMTEGVAHALIIERDQDTIMTGVAAPRAAPRAAKNDIPMLLHH